MVFQGSRWAIAEQLLQRVVLTKLFLRLNMAHTCNLLDGAFVAIFSLVSVAVRHCLEPAPDRLAEHHFVSRGSLA